MRKESIRPFLFLALLTLVVFATNLDGTWILDDHYQVESNPFIRSFSHLSEIFTSQVWKTSSLMASASHIYRPLFIGSYLIDFKIFGLHPWGFHLINNLLHCLNVILLFLLLRKKAPSVLSMICAVFFAVHPVVTEAVTWIGGRMDLLMTFFSLLYIHAVHLSLGTRRPRVFFALSLALIPLGLFSKEPFVLIPFVVWIACVGSVRKSDGKRNFHLPQLLCATVVISACWLWRTKFAGQPAHAGVLPVMLQNTLALFKRYALLLLHPTDLDFLNLYVLNGGSRHLNLILGGVILALILLIAWVGRTRFLWVVGWGLILAPLIPASAVLDLTKLMSERYFYLPHVGLSLILFESTLWISGRWNPVFTRKTAMVAASVMYLAALGLTSAIRNREWVDEPTLYASSMRRDPTNPLPHYMLAKHFERTGQRAFEIAEYERLLTLDPQHLSGLNNLAVRYVEQRKFEKAQHLLMKALQIDPRRAKTFYNLGFLYEMAGRIKLARRAYGEALRLDPRYTNARLALERVNSPSR